MKREVVDYSVDQYGLKLALACRLIMQVRSKQSLSSKKDPGWHCAKACASWPRYACVAPSGACTYCSGAKAYSWASDRMCEQREVVASAGIVDSQSVNAPGARERGYAAHKKVSGRERHVAVDTDGRLSAVNLTPADVADSTGAQSVLYALVKR